MNLLIDLIICRWKRPTLSVRVEASQMEVLILVGPLMLLRLTQTFSALPFLNTILGARVALTSCGSPFSSTTQSAVWAGTSNEYSGVVRAVTMVAREMWSWTEHRASP